MKYYLLTFNEDYADEHDVPALACFTETQYEEWLDKSQWENPDDDEEDRDSKLSASLGNSGDGFEESFEDLDIMREFVDEGFVTVFEVSEEFYKTFLKARLADLSLCNIFEI